VPLTIAGWFRKTGSASSFQEVISLFNPSTGHEFALLAGSGTAASVGAFALGGAGAAANSSTTFSLGQWQHGTAVFTASNQRHAYLNGGGKGTNSTSVSPVGVNQTDVGHGFISYFSGDLAEVAIWNVALSDAEVAALAQGFSPLCLLHRLPDLVLY
jgi:Concanavalin A-like lectin/glucanases superfamily